MRVDILTLFPRMFDGPLSESILKRATAAGALDVRVWNIRDFAADRHRTTDQYPYGGGAGMVLKPEPLFLGAEAAIADARTSGVVGAPSVVLMSPQGRRFEQSVAVELSQRPHLVFVCGHYEGVDERVREHLVTDQISVGDYVLTGGELPAMVVLDAVARLLPGVLGASESLTEESHTGGLLEYPHYTRPPAFRGWAVPDVLLSGNHQAIARWRREQSLTRTLRWRPDLMRTAVLSAEDRLFLASIGAPEYMTPEAETLRAKRGRKAARRRGTQSASSDDAG